TKWSVWSDLTLVSLLVSAGVGIRPRPAFRAPGRGRLASAVRGAREDHEREDGVTTHGPERPDRMRDDAAVD
ncbi:MAG: hypothetical protein LC775_06430, partial [Acidobacteria bacterium]|nr:hypothetical protein [Acidobacteriota bacterium]